MLESPSFDEIIRSTFMTLLHVHNSKSGVRQSQVCYGTHAQPIPLPLSYCDQESE